MRQYYGCPCDGESHKGFGRWKDTQNRWTMGDNFQNIIKSATGVKPEGCPWWYMQNEPLVQEVLGLFNEVEKNPARLNDSLPNILFEGVMYYDRALNRCRNWWWDKDAKRRKEKEASSKVKHSSGYNSNFHRKPFTR